MSQVNTTYLQFLPSGSADVTGYKLYVEANPNPVGYTSPSFDLGNPTPTGSPGVISIDLSTLPGMTSYDGLYNIGVTAVDDQANESSMSIANGVQLDFVAPDPPGPIQVG